MRAGRVPPAREFDAAAAAAAGDAVTDDELREAAAWLAGCTGRMAPVARVRRVTAADAGARPGQPLPAVGHVAAAVDAGRDLAARAAREGITVLVLAEPADEEPAGRIAAWLADASAFPAIRGPLGALWQFGSGELAVACGAALGAGEHGLGLLCEGPGARAAAGLAVAVQPALAPRVSVPASLGGRPAAEAVAVLERACAGSPTA